MEIVNYWLDWTMSLSQLFNHDDYDQRTAMITDLRKHVNGDFNASQLLKRLNTVQKPFSADHWRFSSPAVMFGAAILIAVVTFAIGKKCCAQAQVTAPTTANAALLPATSGPIPATCSTTDAYPTTGAAGVYSAKSHFQFFKANGPCPHLHLITGRAS